jgi:hypothetical protein
MGKIFDNVLMAVILQIIGSAISAFIVIGGLLSTFMMSPLGSPFEGSMVRACSALVPS